MTGDSRQYGTVGAFLFFALAAFAYTWPLPLYIFEGIPYAYHPDPAHTVARMFQGDHLQAYYHISLLKLAALGEIDWFSNPLEFATEYSAGATSDYFLPMSLVYLPFSFFSGPLAYNILIIVSFALGGLAMYLWASELTGSRAAGYAAGVVFNFLPVRMSELLGGHPAGHGIFLFPLTLFFFDRAVTRRSARDAAFGGLSALALSVQYNYFSYYLLMFLMVYIPWRLGPVVVKDLKERHVGRRGLTRLAVAGVPFALGLLATIGYMLHFKNTAVGGSAVAGGRTMAEVALYSPPLSQAVSMESGWSVYMGLALLLLPLSLAYALLPGGPRRQKMDALFFTVVFAASYVLAFGTTLDETVPLYSLFYDYFPYFNFSRTPVKIMVIAASAASILAAYSVVWAASRPNMGVAAFVFFALVAADFHPRGPVGVCLLDEGNPVYERVAKESGGKYTLDLPIWPGESSWSSIYIYYALQSRTPTINGYSPLVQKEYIDNVFWPLFPLDLGDLTAGQAELLESFNVGQIVFHEEAYPPKVSAYPSSFALRRLLASPHLELLEKREPLWLFKLDRGHGGERPGHVATPIGHLFEAENLARINGQPAEDKAAMNGRALRGQASVEGNGDSILNAGPYKTFPSGSYRAAFRIRLGKGEGSVAKIDVAGDEGREILAERVIDSSEFSGAAGYRTFNLDFELSPDRAWQVEFRSFVTGDAEVWVDNVYVLQAGQSDPQYAFEAEDFFYTGRITEDKEASGGKALVSIPGRDPADLMAYGPYRMYEPGAYTALFRLKSSEAPAQAVVASVDVYSHAAGRVIARRDVLMKDLPGPDSYARVSLPFLLTGKDVIEFRVGYGAKSRLAVDSVKVETQGS